MPKKNYRANRTKTLKPASKLSSSSSSESQVQAAVVSDTQAQGINHTPTETIASSSSSSSSTDAPPAPTFTSIIDELHSILPTLKNLMDQYEIVTGSKGSSFSIHLKKPKKEKPEGKAHEYNSPPYQVEAEDTTDKGLSTVFLEAVMRNDLEKVIEIYTKLIGLHPKVFELYVMRGATMSKLCDKSNGYVNADQIIADFNKAINLNPDFAPAYLLLGKIYSVIYPSGRAEGNFDDVIKMRPHYGEADYEKGLLYQKMKMSPQLAESCFAAARKKKLDIEAYNKDFEGFWNVTALSSAIAGQNLSHPQATSTTTLSSSSEPQVQAATESDLTKSFDALYPGRLTEEVAAIIAEPLLNSSLSASISSSSSSTNTSSATTFPSYQEEVNSITAKVGELIDRHIAIATGTSVSSLTSGSPLQPFKKKEGKGHQNNSKSIPLELLHSTLRDSIKLVNPIESIEIFSQVLASNPDSFALHFMRGVAKLLHCEKTDDLTYAKAAIADLSKAIELNSESAPSYIILGHIHTILSNYDEAHRNFDIIEEMRPNWGNPYYGKALVYELQQKHEQAKSCLIIAKDMRVDISQHQAQLEQLKKSAALASAAKGSRNDELDPDMPHPIDEDVTPATSSSATLKTQEKNLAELQDAAEELISVQDTLRQWYGERRQAPVEIPSATSSSLLLATSTTTFSSSTQEEQHKTAAENSAGLPTSSATTDIYASFQTQLNSIWPTLAKQIPPSLIPTMQHLLVPYKGALEIMKISEKGKLLEPHKYLTLCILDNKATFETYYMRGIINLALCNLSGIGNNPPHPTTNPTQVIKDLNKAKELNSDFGPTYCSLAEIHLMLGNFKAADDNLYHFLRFEGMYDWGEPAYLKAFYYGLQWLDKDAQMLLDWAKKNGMDTSRYEQDLEQFRKIAAQNSLEEIREALSQSKMPIDPKMPNLEDDDGIPTASSSTISSSSKSPQMASSEIEEELPSPPVSDDETAPRTTGFSIMSDHGSVTFGSEAEALDNWNATVAALKSEQHSKEHVEKLKASLQSSSASSSLGMQGKAEVAKNILLQKFRTQATEITIKATEITIQAKAEAQARTDKALAEISEQFEKAKLEAMYIMNKAKAAVQELVDKARTDDDKLIAQKNADELMAKAEAEARVILDKNKVVTDDIIGKAVAYDELSKEKLNAKMSALKERIESEFSVNALSAEVQAKMQAENEHEAASSSSSSLKTQVESEEVDQSETEAEAEVSPTLKGWNALSKILGPSEDESDRGQDKAESDIETEVTPPSSPTQVSGGQQGDSPKPEDLTPLNLSPLLGVTPTGVAAPLTTPSPSSSSSLNSPVVLPVDITGELLKLAEKAMTEREKEKTNRKGWCESLRCVAL